MNNVSTLGPGKFPDLPEIPGVAFASGQCNIKNPNKKDVLLVELVSGSVAAGIFTKSKTAAASIDWCRHILPEKETRGLVVNSGNANAFTGQVGVDAVNKIATKAAELIGCRNDQIYIAQTGVIGERLKVDRITQNLPNLYNQLGHDWEDAALTICTTDTFPKGAARTTVINGTKVTITGISSDLKPLSQLSVKVHNSDNQREITVLCRLDSLVEVESKHPGYKHEPSFITRSIPTAISGFIDKGSAQPKYPHSKLLFPIGSNVSQGPKDPPISESQPSPSKQYSSYTQL